MSCLCISSELKSSAFDEGESEGTVNSEVLASVQFEETFTLEQRVIGEIRSESGTANP